MQNEYFTPAHRAEYYARSIAAVTERRGELAKKVAEADAQLADLQRKLDEYRGLR